MFAGLYAIVDAPHPHGLSPAQVTQAVLAERLEGGELGAAVVQLRAKRATTAERIAWATSMLGPCRRARVPLFVNDDLEAALASGAHGVHLGQGDPDVGDLAQVRARARAAGRPDLQIGVSTHDLGQLRGALRERPDYLAFGPVAPTRTKLDPDPVVGISGLADACRIASRPVVAIGGMDAARGEAAIEVGAAAIAVIGALTRPDAASIRSVAVTLARRWRAAAAPLGLDEVAQRIPVLPRALLEELAHWGDSLGVQVELGLPARFRPLIVDGRPQYRPSDVVDLLQALGKMPGESWDAWRERGAEETPALVQLRRRTP